MASKIDEILDFIENYAVSASSADFDKTDSRQESKQALLQAILEVQPEYITKCDEQCQYGEKCAKVLEHNKALDQYSAAIKELFGGSDE